MYSSTPIAPFSRLVNQGSTDHGLGCKISHSGRLAPGLVFSGLLFLTGLLGCGQGVPEVDIRPSASTLDLGYNWQAFAKDAVWNLKLAPTRGEAPLPAAGMATGDAIPSDADYGIKVYFARASDPNWSIQWGGYDSVLDTNPNPNPMTLQAPAGMTAPTGSDGTIIVVDKDLHYAYEIWQFQPRGNNTAYTSSMVLIDVQGSGLHRNVGISGSGLPGVGGLIKSWETKNNVEIRHKIWAAVNPSMLFANAVWPATAHDVGGNGAYASLNYGDVVALTKNLNLDSNDCNLSPFIKRIARALQDYGAIVQDQSGDAMDFVAEVNSIKDYIDVDYNSTFYDQFHCLQKYLVKVQNPWVGATQGGLGYDGGTGVQPPSVPQGLTAAAASATDVHLSWLSSSGQGGVAGYRVFRNGTHLTDVVALKFDDTGVSAGTTYSYGVSAYDSAGHESAVSTAVSVTTPGTGGGFPELLANAGFEGGSASWLLDTWDGTQIKHSVVNAQHHGGTHALRIQITDGQSDGAGTQIGISVTRGATYTASAFVLLQGIQAGAAALFIDWFDSAGNLVGSTESPEQSAQTSSFSPTSVSAQAPVSATHANFYLASWATGSVFFDDASFKRSK